MSIVDQAKALLDILDAWANQNGGKAFVASDVKHLWQLALMDSQVPRVIICYDGEDIRGDFAIAAVCSRVDRKWLVALTRGRGVNAERGDALTEDIGNNPAYYNLLDDLRDTIRAIELDPQFTERPIDYSGIQVMQMGELLADGHTIHFSIGTQLQQLQATPPNPPQPNQP